MNKLQYPLYVWFEITDLLLVKREESTQNTTVTNSAAFESLNGPHDEFNGSHLWNQLFMVSQGKQENTNTHTHRGVWYKKKKKAELRRQKNLTGRQKRFDRRGQTKGAVRLARA